MNKTEQHKKAMLEALEKQLGNVTKASDSIGIGRTTHYDWIREDPEYKKAVDDIEVSNLDLAESKLKERINGVEVLKDNKTVYSLPPDVTAIMYYLNCKGRERGYSYKQQVEHSGGIVINGEVKVVNTGTGIATSESNVDV